MEKKIMLMIGAFITVIIGVILAGIIADNISTNDDTTSVVNETMVITNSTATAMANSPNTLGLVSVGNVYNASNVLITSGNYTTDLTAGTIISKNTDVGNWKVNYVYYTANYIADTTAKTLMNLITLFFILGLIGAVLYYVYGQLKETGLM